MLSRSITIRLEKRLASEPVEMWIAPITEPHAHILRGRLERWAAQGLEALTGHRPNLPDGMINREAEVWWALLALAEHIGGDWPDRTLGAWRMLSSGGDETDEHAEPVQLLADIREAFNGNATISTEALLSVLNGLDESPWGARRRGEGLDARGLARQLRPFKIKPRTVRAGGGNATARGYRIEQFDDAFARHLQEATQATQATQTAPGLERDVSDVLDVSDSGGAER